MATNAFLVRYANGWHEKTDPTSITAKGRREATLSLGAIQSIHEVEQIATKHFESFADTRRQISVTQEPMGTSDTPYVHATYVPGSTVTVPDPSGTPTSERLLSMTVSENENGELSYVPELKDLLLDAEERFDLQVKKMTGGSLGGHSPQASPPAPQ